MSFVFQTSRFGNSKHILRATANHTSFVFVLSPAIHQLNCNRVGGKYGELVQEDWGSFVIAVVGKSSPQALPWKLFDVHDTMQ